MKRTTITLFMAAVFAINLPAQDAKKEIEQNVCLSASNYLAYPGPSQKKLTPAPKGYKPFYISHYGRHGSRYLMDKDEYLYPLQTLENACNAGKLTEFGKDVMKRLKMMYEESDNRYGELTQLGAQQHKDIARRMYERFPEVFGGNADIDARSTVVIRCILSMENEMQQFITLNPKLNIKHDASYHDMYYMNLNDKELYKHRMPRKAEVKLREFGERHIKTERLMKQIFGDDSYVKYEVDSERLYTTLFKLASNLQSSELAKQTTLYDLFTKEEIYNTWLTMNAWWYINFGHCKLNGAKQPFSQRNLLRNIIQQADSCIETGKPGATMRFGHETMVMPLTCLLGLNGYDRQTDDLEKLEEYGWINYKVFPMAANIQFVFYRKNAADKEILVKVLLNENEATLPITTSTAPYYSWEEFKDYYNKKLATFKEDI